MTVDYEAAKRATIATRRKNVQAAIDELIYDAERSANDAWANYDRAKDQIAELKHQNALLQLELDGANRTIAAIIAKIDNMGTMP